MKGLTREGKSSLHGDRVLNVRNLSAMSPTTQWLMRYSNREDYESKVRITFAFSGAPPLARPLKDVVGRRSEYFHDGKLFPSTRSVAGATSSGFPKPSDSVPICLYLTLNRVVLHDNMKARFQLKYFKPSGSTGVRVLIAVCSGENCFIT